jgi:hypothetical protein
MKNITIRGLALLSLLALAPLLHPILTRAADDPAVPGFSELGTGVSVNYVASGELTSTDLPIVRLIVERLVLAEGDLLPDSNAPQIIAVEEGSLAMIDELGLEAALATGEQLFALAGALPEITASASTTLIRASLTAPEADVVIGDASCDPATLSVSNLDGLTISNETLHDQPFGIPGTGVQAIVPASGWALVSIATVPEGDWEARCGNSDTDESAAETLTLDVSGGHQPLPASTADSTILFDNEIEPVIADSSTFFLAELAIAADGTLGKQTYTGPTALIANDQPFWVKRPRRLTSTLAANASFVIPPGTSATIENAGKDATTALVVGIIPTTVEIPELSATDEAVDGHDSRSVTDDDETTPAADTSDLAAYLPSTSAMAGAGFFESVRASVDDIAGSFFDTLTQQWVRDGWVREFGAVYDRSEGDSVDNFAIVAVTEFTGLREAAAAYEEFNLDILAEERIKVPASDYFRLGTTAGMTFDSENEGVSSSLIMARDGNIIISIAVIIPIQEDSASLALAIWEIIDSSLTS